MRDMTLSNRESQDAYLFDFAEAIRVGLVVVHAVLGKVEVSRVHGQLLLVLRHLLQHLREVAHRRRLVTPARHSLVLRELFQLVRHLCLGEGNGGSIN